MQVSLPSKPSGLAPNVVCLFVYGVNVPVLAMYVWCPKKPEEYVRSSENGVLDCCEPPDVGGRH